MRKSTPENPKGEGVFSWPRAVIFDLDGTLVDTVEDLATALNQTLVELDLPPHPVETVRMMVGGGLAKLLDRGLAAHGATLDEGRKERATVLELYAASPAMHSRLYPGAAAALRALREAGIPLGVCTNKPEAIARDLLCALGVAEAFGCIQGGGTGVPKKPDPAGIARVTQSLGARPATTIMVGDSVTDVETARAAGLARIVLVSYGYTASPAHALGADAVIDHLDELSGVLAKLAASER